MKTLKILAIAIAATLTIGAAPQGGGTNWNTTTRVTPAGTHILGNPAATTRLVEFVSYTCSHCATFEQQAGGALRTAYVTPGKLSVEVRSFLRNPVDLTASLLTSCGAPSRFFGNHTAFMRSQATWMARAENISPEKRQQRWSTGEFAARTRAMASDLGFYDMMIARGYDRPAIDRCLADEAKAQQFAAATQEAQKLGIPGTPSFMLNDVLLAGTHDWRTLEPQIRTHM